ncbi:MAG: hypothetical protein Q4D54_08750 [Eubacteriales bacterium]|nr:hypothetical protein [Eubacteriales bacterium]
MAKEKNNKEGSKGTAILIIVLIVLTWLSIMALLIKCDVGGFGSSVLRPIFKDVPIIKEILPDATDAEVAKENDYPYDTLEEALAAVEELDKSNASKDAEIASLIDKNEELTAEVARLSALESEITTFEEEKNKFYDEIVYGEKAPDTDTYIEWYNQLDAEHAEEVYKEIIMAQQADAQIVELAKTYESMDGKDAAKILENMKNDMDTVALIMNNMSSDARGKILANMDPTFAAAITKKLLP